MRFLVDPARVALDAAGWLFLAVIGVLLPLAALQQHRRLKAGTVQPTRLGIYASAFATHAVFGLMVWAVARGERLDLLPPYRLTTTHMMIGLVALASGLLLLLERFRIDDPVARERTRLIAPRTPTEFGIFYLLSITAGIVEELTYRGLLFTLLAALLGSWWLSAVIAAAVFGIVHLFQGWKSAGVAALIGLREHIVVGLTGTLVIAIVVHTIHDAIAGTVIGLRARTLVGTTGAARATENFTRAEGAAENS